MNNTRKDDYWCHTCSKKIRPRQDKKPEIICSECNGDFVEIMENETNNTSQNNNSDNNTMNNNQQQNQQNNQQPNQHHQFNVRNFFGMPINNIQFINLGDNMNNMGGMGGMENNNNPLNGIQQFLQMLANRNGENMGGMGGMGGLGNFLNFGFPGMGGMGGNMGDYVFGNQQFDEILSRLMEQAKGGAPPASKDALKELRLFNITQKEIDENAECSVCKDEYELDEEVKIMPCKHMFHKDCLDPWLKLRNTCPVCRYELKSKEEKEKDEKDEKDEKNNNNNNNNEDMDDDSDSHDEMGFPSNRSSSNNNHYI